MHAKYCLGQKASCLEISPDGSTFLVGQDNGQLISLHMLNETLIVSNACERHQSKITDIAFNPTADLIATCSNENKIELSSFKVDISKPGNRKMSMSMNDSVRALTFMEDLANHSNILFSGVGCQICITDCSSGTTFRVLRGHRGVITSFCTWGGCMFASSSADRTIRLWDMRVSEAVRVFDPLRKPIATCVFHVDGTGRILIRGDAGGVIHIFDTSSMKKITTKRFSSQPISCLRLAHTQRLLAVADKDRIALCDLRDVMQIAEWPCVAKCSAKNTVLRWHPTNPSIATLDTQSSLNFWQLQQ
ncbi:unnamed protein product [Thelazia callipaeda]|uniref:WD_REPEATS_REGION domain-containing protein n=1 Tax=Thelazia callipaeda TaxID=103827 RepID=A0A0N5CU29_THECL|nr:unnamed protein product [Thelazia callipaeda]